MIFGFFGGALAVDHLDDFKGEAALGEAFGGVLFMGSHELVDLGEGDEGEEA